MLSKGFRLPFRLAGIPLYLDVSFLLILPIMVWTTARNLAVLVHQPQFGLDFDPALFTGLTPLALGLFSVIGLFASVVLHELGHSITARWYGVKVRRITLWFLGGVAEFAEMPRQRGAEAVVGIAGPIVSFVLSALFFGLTLLVPRSLAAEWIVVWYLGAVNLMLGLFNLLPALPMDGGRILRSLLALRMPRPRATMIAGNVARVVAGLMIVYGLFNNLWLILLALFIWNAVKAETRQGVVGDLLQGLGVADLMSPAPQPVPAGLTVGQLTPYAASTGQHTFPVADEQGRLIGTIGPEEAARSGPATPLWQAMTPGIVPIHESATALEALGEMGRLGVPRLVVTDATGHLLGLISQADLMRAVQARMAGFQVAPGQPTPVQVQRVTPAGPFTPPPPFGYTPTHAPRDPQRYARPL